MSILQNKDLLRKYRNLEGEQFGDLTVLSCESDKTKVKGFSNLKWLCKCACGKTKVILGSTLVYGLNKSCGCGMHGSKRNYIGRRIGHLTIIDYSEDGWICKCDCGKKIVKPFRFIHRPQSSTIPDCGNHKTSGKHQKLINDLSGLMLENWEVLKRDYDYTGSHVKYLCKNNNTGEIKSLFSFYILLLKRKEENKKLLDLDLTNQQFGDLTVIRRFTEKRITLFQYYNKVLYTTTYRKKTKYSQWICRCSCGNLIVYTSKDLLNDNIVNCGCKSSLTDNSNRVLYIPRRNTRNRVSYEGLSLGWLTILKEVEKDSKGDRLFLCKCKCGKEKMIPLRNLRTGTCSCGCLKLKENRGNKKELLRLSKEAMKKWMSEEK